MSHQNQPGQHVLLSAKARTLSLSMVMRMLDVEAFETFTSIRWASTEGAPFCPRCGCVTIYNLSDGRFKCAACLHKFSVTSGTIFASRKMAIRDILAAIAIFANGAKGHSALQLSRDLDCQYKTAFVLSHKIREALSKAQEGPALTGEVEVDGAYFGGYVKPANEAHNRRDRRLAENRTGKRQVVVIMRWRGGRSFPFVTTSEAAGVPAVVANVAPTATIFADKAAAWDRRAAKFLTKRINHQEAYSTAEACTNWAKSYFSRIRRAELGIHHHIAGKYLSQCANELAVRQRNGVA
jgi:transposase-like protein